MPLPPPSEPQQILIVTSNQINGTVWQTSSHIAALIQPKRQRYEQNNLSTTVRYRLSFSRILNILFGLNAVSYYQGYSNCVQDEAKMK
ncbi:MAG: hypothetical protein ACPG6Q_05215, partial [Candidatus Puniceispirillaceae bacterium]